MGVVVWRVMGVVEMERVKRKGRMVLRIVRRFLWCCLGWGRFWRICWLILFLWFRRGVLWVVLWKSFLSYKILSFWVGCLILLDLRSVFLLMICLWWKLWLNVVLEFLLRLYFFFCLMFFMLIVLFWRGFVIVWLDYIVVFYLVFLILSVFEE